MKKKLTTAATIALLALGSTSCITLKTERTGECFYDASEGWSCFHDDVREFMLGGMACLTEEEVYETFGCPHQIMVSPKVKAVGWAYDHMVGRGLNLAVIESENRFRAKYMLTCAFNNDGVLVDYYTWSSEKPTDLSVFRTQPIIQAAIAARAIYLLSDMLEDTLYHAEAKAEQFAGKLEQRARDCIKEAEQRIRQQLNSP